MTAMGYACKGYNVEYNDHLKLTKGAAQRYATNKFTERLDQHQEGLYANRMTNVDSDFFPFLSISREGSTMSDEYYSSSDLMSYESPWESELPSKYSRPYQSDIDWSLTHSQGGIDCSQLPALPTSRLGKREEVFEPRGEHYCTSVFSTELSDLRRVMVPRSTDMWSFPSSPIYQTPHYPTEDTLSDLESVFTNPMMRTVGKQIGEGDGSAKSFEKWFDEPKNGLVLFVTTDNAEELKVILRERRLEVQDITKTRTPGVLAVLFKTHIFAKRAFITQKEIGLRMVPLSTTERYWWRNPSPKFHVIFETTRRLTIKSGKKISNVKVGDFLMMDAKMDRGCLIWADQMKGHRIRVVGYVGKFMSLDGCITEQTVPPSMAECKVIGWISTQCNKTKEKFVLRKSGNQIEDYVHDNRVRVFE